MSLTGRQLLDALKDLSDEELEQPVYVYADHGQEHYVASQVSANELTTSLEYCLEDYYVHPDDLGSYEGVELHKFIEIS